MLLPRCNAIDNARIRFSSRLLRQPNEIDLARVVAAARLGQNIARLTMTT
jgi:hypothetical protein